jgi:hypothetical protein
MPGAQELDSIAANIGRLPKPEAFIKRQGIYMRRLSFERFA